MMLSKASEYGVRALLHLASYKKEGFVPIRQLCDELDLSFHFMTKIFQRLTQAGILRSFRGPAGGISLALPADQIRLLDVIIAIDGNALFTQCLLGLPGCGEEAPCPLHEQWGEERRRLEILFAGNTLEDVAVKIRKENSRLSTYRIT